VCGRYTLTVPLSNLVDAFDVPPPEFDYRPRYNIAPTQDVPVVARDERGQRMGLLRWGLIPSWSKDPGVGSRMINARSETAAEKPSFRSAFRRRRCLVPADGFYEWERHEGQSGTKGTRTPHWIHLSSQEPFAFAGLWERWDAPEGPPLFTFTILTTEAAPEMAHIHPRMPVILLPQDRDPWLDPGTEVSALKTFLRPLPGHLLRARMVSTRVNSPRHDDPECLRPA
jgi:putative SOS response-associated peptidase YedK